MPVNKLMPVNKKTKQNSATALSTPRNRCVVTPVPKALVTHAIGRSGNKSS